MRWQLFANLLGFGQAKTADDTGELQLFQVVERAAGSGFEDRVLDKVRRVMEFGFTSVPPIDSEVVMLRGGGDRACSLIIATSHRPSRLKNMKPGDTALHDVRGAYLKFTEAGCEIDAAGLEVTIKNASKVTIDSADVVLTGDLHVAGEVYAKTNGAQVGLGQLRDAYNPHTHGGPGTDHPV